MFWDDIELRKTTKVPVANLSFDKHNPRYTSDKGLPHDTDEEIISFLAETSDLEELLQSISTSGYVDIEPLIVWGDGDSLVVLEGNRRLAALKLLSDAQLAARCELIVPPMAEGKEDTLTAVSVYRVPDRDEARDFIGFKHINGAHRWDSIAKARYAADWLKDEMAKGDKGLTLKQIAQRMGDRHSTLQRMVAGIYVLDQSVKLGLFEVEDREQGRQFAFSHLYTALTRPGFRQFLGLSLDRNAEQPEPDPVEEEFYPNLKQVMLWLYGSESERITAAVRSQNPHLKQLSAVLDNPKARKIMLEANDLPRAYAEVDTPLRQFEKRLVEAHGALEDSMRKASSYDGHDETLLDIANEIFRNADNLVVLMERAHERTKS